MKPIKRLHNFEGSSSRQQVTATTLSSKYGNIILSGTSDGAVNVFTLGNSMPLFQLRNPTNTSAVTCMTFDPLEDYLLVAYANGQIILWDLESDQMLRTLKSSSKVFSLAFHPFSMVFACLNETQIELWDLQKKSKIHLYNIPEYHRPATRLSFSPDGLFLVCGASHQNRAACLMYDLEKGSISDIMLDNNEKNVGKQVNAIGFHPHELILSMGTSAGILTLFDLQTKKAIAQLPLNIETNNMEDDQIQDILFSEDGNGILASSRCGITVWNISNLSQITQQTSLKFSSDNLNPQEARYSSIRLSIGYGHYLIISSLNGSTLTTWYFNVHQIGWCYDKTHKKITADQTPPSPGFSAHNDAAAEMDEDESFYNQMAQDSQQTQLIYQLRNRLDHLKGLRATWSGKSSPSLIHALAKQSSASKTELLGELISSKILELSLSSSWNREGALSAQTIEDVGILLNIIRQSMKHMDQTHQLHALEMAFLLAKETGTSCQDKLMQLQEEIDRIALEKTDSLFAKKAKELRALLIVNQKS